jgi:hypothetical protein
LDLKKAAKKALWLGRKEPNDGINIKLQQQKTSKLPG